MRSATVFILLAFLAQSHANEPAAKHMGSTQDKMNETVDKFVDMLLGSPVTQVRVPQMRSPLVVPGATKNVMPFSSLSPSSSLMPSRHKSLQVKKRYATRSILQTRAESHAIQASSPDDGSKDVDMTGSVFNLLKNIVGLGALSLPAGVAAVGGEKALLAPAIALFIVMGALSGYGFYSIGRQCGIQKVSTFDDAWEKSVGKNSKWVVTFIALIFPLLGCMGYSIIMGDSFSALARSGALGNFLATNPLAGDRRTWILGVTAGALFPLCCLKKLGSLAITSLLGTMAIAYTGAFMAFRLFQGSYLTGGCFHGALCTSKAALPSFAAAGGGLLHAFQAMFSRSGTFVLLAMSGAAYCAHQNAPIFFDEAGRDLGKFKKITIAGFGLAIVLNLLFLITGFATFGSAAAGNILKNYAKTDGLATLANGLYGGSVIATYPLIYVGMKPVMKGVFDKFKSLSLLASNQALSTLPLALITATACVVPDAGIVNAICGAICGASLIYILPALMYLKQADKNAIEKYTNVGLLGLGIVMAVLGVYTSLAPR